MSTSSRNSSGKEESTTDHRFEYPGMQLSVGDNRGSHKLCGASSMIVNFPKRHLYGPVRFISSMNEMTTNGKLRSSVLVRRSPDDVPRAIGLRDIQLATTRDPILQRIICMRTGSCHSTGVVRRISNDQQHELDYLISQQKHQIRIVDGVLLLDEKLVLPFNRTFRHDLLRYLYIVYKRDCAMLVKKSKEYFYWSRDDLSSDYADLYGTEPLLHITHPTYPQLEKQNLPFKSIYLELTQINDDRVVILIDRYTMWPMFTPMEGEKKLVKFLIKVFELSCVCEDLVIVCDDSSIKTGYIVSSLKKYQIHTIKINPVEVDVNLEHVVITVKSILSSRMEPVDMNDELTDFVNTPQPPNTLSPATLLLGAHVDSWCTTVCHVWEEYKLMWEARMDEEDEANRVRYIRTDLKDKIFAWSRGTHVAVTGSFARTGIVTRSTLRVADTYAVKVDGSGRIMEIKASLLCRYKPVFECHPHNPVCTTCLDPQYFNRVRKCLSQKRPVKADQPTKKFNKNPSAA